MSRALVSEPRKRSSLVELVHNLFDWYPSHYPEKERKFLRKLDCSILIYATLSYFVMHLDQSNVQNAYVSGMKESLKLGGNDLNYLSVAYYTAYVCGQIPMLAIQTRPQFTRRFLPCLTIVWAILTFAQSKATKAWHMYLLRALIGFAEAPTFTGTHYVLGSWYRPEELFKRAGTWFTAYSLGNSFSGYLQAAAYNNLNGVAGRAGWQWLFIIDGIFTLPISIIGFALYPGLPASPRAWFMSEEEYALAQERLPEDHKQSGKISFDVVKRFLKEPMTWIMIPQYIFLVTGTYFTGLMTLWLKAEGYSTAKVNVYAAFIPLVAALTSWVGASLSGGGVVSPWIVYSVGQVAMLFCSIVLYVWNVPLGLKFFAFYISGFSGIASPVEFSWINVQLRHDPEVKALLTSTMLTIGYSFYIWVPLLTFPTVQAPKYHKGYLTSIIFVLLTWGFGLVAFYFYGKRNGTKIEATKESDKRHLVKLQRVIPDSEKSYSEKEGSIEEAAEAGAVVPPMAALPGV